MKTTENYLPRKIRAFLTRSLLISFVFGLATRNEKCHKRIKMKRLLSILFLFWTFLTAFSQDENDENLITNPYRFNNIDDVIKKGKYRLRIKFGKNNPSVTFKLFEKNDAGKWKLLQTENLQRENPLFETLDTSEDLNNDGFRDIKIGWANAGRGSNSLEKLFIFDPDQKKLVNIINSQDYPNLHYNKVRNCITAYAFYGENTTYFLDIKANKLEEIGRVDWDGEFATSYRIENGNEILLRKIPYKSDEATVFFDDFDPIE